MDWQWVAFDGLSLRQLHDLLQLRNQVFVLEQNCVYQDIDGFDPQAMHLLGYREGQLLAYARCFGAGIKFPEASIGRVVTRGDARGAGLGHQLMTQALAAVRTLWGAQPVRIGAQAHLHKFYRQHGFVAVGKPYVEDGIDHLEMVWQPTTSGDFK
jgi:ElaA protein